MNENKMRSHLVAIMPMVPFTLKSTSNLHLRYSIVIPCFILNNNNNNNEILFKVQYRNKFNRL